MTVIDGKENIFTVRLKQTEAFKKLKKIQNRHPIGAAIEGKIFLSWSKKQEDQGIHLWKQPKVLTKTVPQSGQDNENYLKLIGDKGYIGSTIITPPNKNSKWIKLRVGFMNS